MQGGAGPVGLQSGKVGRGGLGLGRVATHSLPPFSLEKERGSGCGADRGATSGTAAEPEAPPSASQSLRAPERRGADTLQQGEFEALWAPVEDSAEHGFPPFSCLRG